MRTLLAIIAILFITQLSAQDVVRLSLNNKVIGTVKFNMGTPVRLTASRLKYRNIKTGMIEIIHQQPIPAYKESLEITDENENVLVLTAESGTRPGKFIFSNPASIKSLLKRPRLKIFLLQNPRNEQMSMPSRRNLLAELDLK